MKKVTSILVLVFVFTLTTQAQKQRRGQKKQSPEFTTEQFADLAVKKMTLALDLSKKQQNQIKPLISEQAADRKAEMDKRKESRENREAKKRPTSDEIYAMQSKKLDKQIAFRSKMKEILNEEQFVKFDKMKKGRNKVAMNKMKNKKNSEKFQQGK